MPTRRTYRADDSGFTLVELLVSLTVFAVFAVAAGGMLLGGFRASLVAKLDTGAKNLGQERLEQIRNLPFHIDHPMVGTPAVAGASETDDVLDTYFPRYSASSVACATTGFVAAASARCTADGDPAAGDFYRVVINPIPGFAKYRQYISTQFLGSSGYSGAALTVPASYNTQGDPSSADIPVSSFIGVNVATFWTAGALQKKLTLFSLVQQGRPAATVAAFSGRAVALKLSGPTVSGTTSVSEVGLVSLDGTTARNTTASTVAQSVYTGADPGDRISGSCALSSSGGASPACAAPVVSGSMRESGNVLGSFSNSSVTGVQQSTTGGLPKVGDADAAANPTALVTAGLTHTGNAPDISGSSSGSLAYAFNGAASGSAAVGRSDLRMTTGQPLVWLDKSTGPTLTVCGNASSPAVAGTGLGETPGRAAGYGVAVSGVNHVATSCVHAHTQTTHLFPTDFAPAGVVQVAMSGQLMCRTNGGVVSGANPNGGQAVASYSGTVSYWSATGGAGGTPGYVTVAVGSTSAMSNTVLSDALLDSTTVYPGLTLRAFVAKWTNLTTSVAAQAVLVDQDKNSVQADLPAFFSLQSAGLTEAATTSLSAEWGRMACTAEDNR
jgi:prepilin-type N-terminal cleavage/methylation domain-containing protein